MFDGSLPEIADLQSLTDAELVDAAGGWVRSENAAAARKVAVMAEIFARRTGLSAADREMWWVDPEAAVAAELAAVLNVSQGVALHQTHRGVALRDRLPKVGALFEQGLVSDLLVRTIVWRTYLIADDEAMAKVDAELAERVVRWGALSARKTEAAIDALVEHHDSAALRRSRLSACSETVEFGSPADPPGTTSIWARLNSPDAALIEESVEALAHSVCDADPRSMDQRRANALTAAVTHTAFGCACGEPDCPAAARADAPAKNAVVYVVMDHESIGGAGTDTASACTTPPAYVFGAGMMPTPLLGAILDRARIREVHHPGSSSPPEPRYTPSRTLMEFVRCRDLTCRFPGCDKPAQVCDIDHTVAYPVGPTHPSNLKCLCRFHHLLKTFWNGADGWRDRQLPDGAVVWTSPTGHTYCTYPGSLHHFPKLCRPTAALWSGEPPQAEASVGRAVMMPKRRRTRAQAIAKAKAAERKLDATQPVPVVAPPEAVQVRPWEDYFTHWRAGRPPDDDDQPPF